MLMKIEKDSKFNTNFVQVELYVIVYILVFDFYISENSFLSLKKLEIEIAQGFEGRIEENINNSEAWKLFSNLQRNSFFLYFGGKNYWFEKIPENYKLKIFYKFFIICMYIYCHVKLYLLY